MGRSTSREYRSTRPRCRSPRCRRRRRRPLTWHPSLTAGSRNFYPDTIDPLDGDRDAPQPLRRARRSGALLDGVHRHDRARGAARQRRGRRAPHVRRGAPTSDPPAPVPGRLRVGGEYRTVNMSKGPGRGFGDVKTGEVDRYLSTVQQLVTSTDWGGPAGTISSPPP